MTPAAAVSSISGSMSLDPCVPRTLLQPALWIARVLRLARKITGIHPSSSHSLSYRREDHRNPSHFHGFIRIPDAHVVVECLGPLAHCHLQRSFGIRKQFQREELRLAIWGNHLYLHHFSVAGWVLKSRRRFVRLCGN